MREQRAPSRAVIESHAPSRVERDSAEQALWRALDYFPTPPWASRAIAHRLRDYDPGAEIIAEPACGMGHFAAPLAEVFGPGNLFASDIYAYGYGEVCDFLGERTAYDGREVDWFVTNPPFPLAAAFVMRALRLARRGVIVLCRTAFLESAGREVMLWEGDHPLTTLMPFVERVPMQLGSWDPDLSSATSYSAFAFHRGRAATPPLPFRSGTRQLYTLSGDAARFALPAPVPLFDNMAALPLFQGENHDQ